MSSLKGFIPGLARQLGITADALYERQRALTRAGLLAASEGRGPGSGVRTTAPSVALLLIAVLASGRLAESAERAGAIADARREPGQGTPLVRSESSFLGTLAHVLAATGMAASVTEITISRTADRAEIRHWTAGGIALDRFVGADAEEPGISIKATLHHDLLQQIAADVQALLLQT